MKRRSREDVTVLVLFITWCIVTTLRAMFAAPPSPWWFAGIVATAGCMLAAGWVLGRRYERRRRRRER